MRTWREEERERQWKKLSDAHKKIGGLEYLIKRFIEVGSKDKELVRFAKETLEGKA